ncbi:hypothetical protein D3C76_1336710 [compost metagenome]
MAHKAVHFQQRPGERRSERQRQRRAHVKQPHDAGAVALGEPLGGEVDHAGEEACLRCPQQGADQQELTFRVGPRHRRGEEPPQQRGGANPCPCAKLAHQQVSGHPQQGVNHKEDPGAQGIGFVTEPGINLVALFGEADIRAIQKCQHVERQHERDQAGAVFPDHAVEQSHTHGQSSVKGGATPERGATD